jgi:polyhydroxybutyrate depolymerase
MTRFFATFTAFITVLVSTAGCQVDPDVLERAMQSGSFEAQQEARSGFTPVTPPAFDPCGDWQEPGEYALTVPGFEDRTALVYVPATEGPRDAVVMLHGAKGTGAQARNITRYRAEAEARGMVSVFPDGIDEVWRAGFGGAHVHDGGIDDVAYLSALSDALADEVCVDRILAAGFSNGSMMVQRWACEGTGVDAVVAAGGARMEHECRNPATPIVLSHGLQDGRITYDGSPSPQTGKTWPSARATAYSWVDHNDWNGTVTSTQTGPIHCQTWEGTADTTLCSIDGWGHAWPGGRNTAAFAPQYDLTATSLEWFQGLVTAGVI